MGRDAVTDPRVNQAGVELEKLASGYARLGLAGQSIYEYVLERGETMVPAAFDDCERGMPRQCFQNAGRWAQRDPGVRYVEGFALPDWGGEPGPLLVHHAWLVDALTGEVYETTWHRAGWSYYGIRFEPEEHGEALHLAETWDVLEALVRRGKST